MKKLIITLTAMAMGMLMCGVAYAGSCGVAAVPGIIYKYKSGSQVISCKILLSNITNEEVEATVDFFDQDGNLITTNGTVKKGSGTVGAPSIVANNTNVFTIPPHGTRSIQFYQTSGQYWIEGHAIVKWQSMTPSLTKALIGKVYQDSWYNNQFYGWNGVLINNGMPF